MALIGQNLLESTLSDSKTKNIVANQDEKVKKSSLDQRIIVLLDKAKTLPKHAGCYLMQGKNGEVLYVGKAKNLKARVTSYFNNSAKTPKTQILVGHIHDFEFILTNSEAESYVLENNLIKEHKPKYNIRLKDDKSYPYIQVNFNESFPRLEYVRRPKLKKGVELFGPYPSGSNISQIMKVITKALKLRDCSLHEFNTRTVACILYQMHQCSAPCVGTINEEEYSHVLTLACNFFRSEKKAKATLEYLTQQMMDYAENEKFEQAALLRDYIETLDEFCQNSYQQNVELQHNKDLDVIGYYVGSEELDISIYMVRNGHLLGHKNFNFLKDDFLDNYEVEIKQILIQYYSQTEMIPPDEIVTSFKKMDSELFEQALKNIANYEKVKIRGNPRKYQQLLQMTNKHAQETQRVRIENQDSVYIGLNKLKSLLNLKDRPKVLECYDIAIWQGKSPTASQIVFEEGKADKTRYRYYHLKELPEGNNDFAMMREVFERRLKKDNLPDVFVVDGGIQQVNTVSKVLEEFNIAIPVVGIAKAREIAKAGFRSQNLKHSDERLVIPGRSNPYILNKCPSLMKILVYMRDEAHRFSRKLHHKAEKERVLTSWVDSIKGFNKNIKQKILQKNTYSLEELKLKSKHELRELFDLEIKHASILFEHLHAEEN